MEKDVYLEFFFKFGLFAIASFVKKQFYNYYVTFIIMSFGSRVIRNNHARF